MILVIISAFAIGYGAWYYGIYKLKDNKYDINYWALGGTAVVALFVLTYFMAIYSDKSAQQSRQQLKQEIVKDVIDSLHKEQQKTINYKDSVNQNVR